MLFWWIVALFLFIGWMAGFDLVGYIVLSIILVIITLSSLAGVDRRRRRLHPHDHYAQPP